VAKTTFPPATIERHTRMCPVMFANGAMCVLDRGHNGPHEDIAGRARDVKPSGAIRWHEYKNVKTGNEVTAWTYCGEKWYERGKAPCELQDADDAAALDLPACEDDIAAMREVLGLKDTATVCRFKGRASWDDKLPESPGVLAGTLRIKSSPSGDVAELYDGVRWIEAGDVVVP